MFLKKFLPAFSETSKANRITEVYKVYNVFGKRDKGKEQTDEGSILSIFVELRELS